MGADNTIGLSTYVRDRQTGKPSSHHALIDMFHVEKKSENKKIRKKTGKEQEKPIVHELHSDPH